MTNAVKQQQQQHESQRRIPCARRDYLCALRMNALCFDIICAPIATVLCRAAAQFRCQVISILSRPWFPLGQGGEGRTDRAVGVHLRALLRPRWRHPWGDHRLQRVRIVFERLWWITTSGDVRMWRDVSDIPVDHEGYRVSAVSWETRVRSRARRAVTRSRRAHSPSPARTCFPHRPGSWTPKNPYAVFDASLAAFFPLRDETNPSTTRRRRRVSSRVTRIVGISTHYDTAAKLRSAQAVSPRVAVTWREPLRPAVTRRRLLNTFPDEGLIIKSRLPCCSGNVERVNPWVDLD